jgi:exosome complex component MTR3
VDVYVQVLQADGEGALLVGAVGAAGAALAEAGVEMLGLPVGCAAVRVGEGPGESWLDPSEQEHAAARGGVGVVCLPAVGSVTGMWQWGELGLEELEQVRLPFLKHFSSPCPLGEWARGIIVEQTLTHAHR